MTDEQANQSSELKAAHGGFPSPPLPSQAPGILSRIFFSSRGLRSGWRLLIFIAIFYVCVQIIVLAFPKLAHVGAEGLTPGSMLLRETIFLLVALLSTATMGVFESRSFADYLFPWRQAFRARFWWGALWGLVALSILLAAIRLDHGFLFGHLALAGLKIPDEALSWALVFIAVGLSEEVTFRGYPLFTLTDGMGFWPAAIVLSAAFGAVHLGNPGEDWAGALAAGLIAMFFCFTVRRTGTLWFAIGLHAMWDYAETFLYSVPNSGLVAKGHLLSSSFHGPRWLTGGSVGPEGSALVFAVIGILFAVFHYLYPEARFPQPSKTETRDERQAGIGASATIG
jgi:membrane protease YdiL (CAAX protease family)